MSKVRRVDYFPDEYVSGVGGVLSAAEQGVYWMVCSLVMSAGGPIANDARRLAGLCLLRPSEARRTIDKLVSSGKLSLSGDGKLYQKRAQSEVERSAKRIQTASENGAKGGRPSGKPQENQQTEKADGLSAEKLTNNYQLATKEETSEDVRTKPAKRRHSYTASFSEFWSGYPTDALMSKLKASQVFEKLEGEDQASAIRSLPAFKAHCASHPDYRPVHAERYLRERRFDGFLKTVEATEAKEFVAMGSDDWSAILRLRQVVSLPHKDFGGRHGWMFDKREIERARRAPAAINWQTRGAA